VKEVRRADSVVRRPLQPAVCVPCAAIQQLAPEQLVLTLTAAQVDDLWWALAGEDVVISLSGSYD
jgi:hypothetical protein